MIIVKKLSDNSKTYLETYYEIVEQMRREMADISPTQSISETFINQMIPHHQAAIRLSENVLNFTTDTEIEALAKEIITGANAEIQDMRDMLDSCKACENSARDVSLYMREFSKVFDTMIKHMNGASMGNNVNANFLNGMIYHHEGEIGMLKNLLQFEICNQLKEMAENMLIGQTAQLSKIKTLLRRISQRY